MPIFGVSSEPLLVGLAAQDQDDARFRPRSFTRERLAAAKSFAEEKMAKLSSSLNITPEEMKTKARQSLMLGILVGVTVFLTLTVSAAYVAPNAALAVCGELTQNVKTVQEFSAQSQHFVAVNLGGWLCLEDWFHSGAVGRYVSTPYTLQQGQGACLPPLLSGPLDQPWPSEGVLVNRLENSDYSASEIFQAFRDHFVKEQDFAEIASLGMKTVRIPFHWSMFADALVPVDAKTYGSHNPDWDSVVIPDPYHTDTVSAVTIPRAWFKEKLLQASKYGLKIILDLHTMPGGSSDGTYSGVWPLEPAYWTKNSKLGNTSIPLRKIGFMIAKALVRYIETDLADLVNSGNIWGVCFMNEPAHLSGTHAKWGRFATPDQVLHDVGEFAEIFRRSTLPSRGTRMYIQLIETAWDDPQSFDTQVTHWYHSFFTSKERYNWAVIARHFYTAWGCNGQIVQGSAYQCDEPIDRIRGILNGCITGFAQDFAMKFHGLRAVTEWSIGTHYDANMACNNPPVLRTLFEENVRAFALIDPEIQIEPVFWSWKMPYGPKFKGGWSLKTFAGMDELSDSNGECVVGAWAKESPLDVR